MTATTRKMPRATEPGLTTETDVRCPFPRVLLARLAATVLLGSLVTSTAIATAAQKDKKKEIPEPEHVTLETKDGLRLRATWYAGTEGKDSVPIIALHGWKGQRGDYHGLALGLQRLGHAVLVPDMRGHGESNFPVSPDDMRREHFASMIWDVEAAKKFLMEKNNEGELNIELLCVIAADSTTITGLNWVVQDWSWPQLPSYKQGQDVKALVLLSPQQSFQGVSSRTVFRHPFIQGKLPIDLSVMIVIGKNDPAAMRDGKRIHTSFSRFHPDPPRDREMEERDLFLLTPDTSLQGTQLLSARGLGVSTAIARFIHYRLVVHRDKLPWSNRENPFGS